MPGFKLREKSFHLMRVQAAPHLRPSSYTSLAKTFFPDNPQFADFVAAFLLSVRDSEIDVSDYEPAVAINAFELFSSCYRWEPFSRIRSELGADQRPYAIVWQLLFWQLRILPGSFCPCGDSRITSLAWLSKRTK
jgi:hypothetical protein